MVGAGDGEGEDEIGGEEDERVRRERKDEAMLMHIVVYN